MTAVQLAKPSRGLSPSRALVLMGGAVGVLLALMIFLGTWYTVDQGERAVLLRNGAFVSVEAPGLHFKAP